MGMDCYSRRKPADSESPYFRASVWSWHPINALMLETGAITDDEHRRMSTNDGHGPAGASCLKIACRLQKWLDEHPGLKSFELDSDARVDERGCFIAQVLVAVCPKIGRSAYFVARDHLEEFVSFCLGCASLGGFRVW